MFRSSPTAHSVFCCLLALTSHLAAGEIYFTSYENFTVGDDKISGTDSWVGTYNGSKLHGIVAESEHGVLGIGNAGFVGGNPTAVTKTTSGNSVYVRRPVPLDPVALNQEILTFSVIFGISDSSTTSRRDNFEYLVFNQANQLLGGIQFDNSTLDLTGKPRRLIYRLSWNVSSNSFQYVLTDLTFLSETLEPLEIRINYRTNLWSASLSDVPIFQDIPFYTGSLTKNFGSMLVKMAVINTTTTSLLPGDNFMLFDDYTVRTDPVTTQLETSKIGTGPAQLTWNEEAGYSYQVQYSSDLSLWKTDLANSTRTAALTGNFTFTDPSTVIPTRRFYRLKCTSP